MSKISYLIFHKDHPLDPNGVNAGAQNATLALAQALTRLGVNVVVCAELVGGECLKDGVQFWDLGERYDVEGCLQRARALGAYHLISAGRAHCIMAAAHEPLCLSKVLICHDPSGAATGVRSDILSKQVDRIVCVSNAQKDLFIQNGADPKKISVINNGADLECFYPGENSNRDPHTLLFVGALVQDKGIGVLLQSFQILKAEFPNLKLDVYGSAAMWKREELFNPAEIEKSLPGVRFYGARPHTEVAAAYRKAGLCVLPSIWFDSFPLTAVEAQVSGCPVVTFDVGGMKETMSPGVSGFIAPQISVEALTVTLRGLLADPQRLSAVSKETAAYARARFDWKKTAQAVRRLCETEINPALVRKPLAVVSTWNQRCGLATYARYLLSEMVEGSYVVLAEDVERSTLTRADESYVERIWKRGGDLHALCAAIKRHAPGMVQFNLHSPGFFDPNALKQVTSELARDGITSVAVLHTSYTTDVAWCALVRCFDQIIVHTEQNRLQVVAMGIDPTRVHVVPHGIAIRTDLPAVDVLRKKLGLNQSVKLLTCFGFVQPHKGMDGLIEAVAALRAKGVAVEGCIVGQPNPSDPGAENYLAQLKDFARTRGVTEYVHFITRFVSDEETGEYLKAADLVLMNYRSQHYESSGACSLALGAGALVATSMAPPFLAFGDAVWHITSGFDVTRSAELLLQNAALRTSILNHAQQYIEAQSWPATAGKFLALYREWGFAPSVAAKPITVSQKPAPKEIRALFQNRPTAYTHPGGDTVLMNRIKDRLETLGVRVTVDLEGRADPRQFDIVHLFNFATPAYTQSLAENAWKYGIPFVVSTLCEDISLFQNQALVWAQFMTEYVRNGQDAGWYSKHRPDLAQVTPCAPFPNQWLAEHAAALYTNGAAESATIRRLYPGAHGITEIKLGYELGAKGDSEKFIKAYGIKDFILCVGRLEHRKNQLGLLKALEDSDLPVVLAAGGFSYQSDYAAAVKRFKRRGQTLILGRLDDEMLASAYAAAKVHVLPSWYELPGLVSLEAGCHGCNVVVTRNGTAPDYLGDQAFYCDPGDENSILLAVTQAFHSPIKHRLKEVVMANTWDKVGEQTRASYNKVLNIEQPLPTESTQVIDLAPLGVMDFDSGLTAFQDLLERGELAAKSRSYTEAHALLSQAEQMSPNSRRVLRARAATYLAESKVDESMRYFDRALAISTNDSKCLIGRGMCEMMRNNTKGAYDYFVKALRIDGNELIAINQLIQCAFTEGRFDDLQVILERYVASHPGDNEMRFCLAGCYYKQGRIASATEHNAKILAENPHHLGAGQLRDEIAKASSVQSMPKASAPSSNPLTVHSEPVRKANSSESSAAAVAPVVAPTISDTGVKQIEELEELKHRRQHLDVLARVDSMIQNAIFSPDQRERLTLIKGECLALTGDLAQAKSIFNAIVTANPISCRGICDQATLMIVDGDWQQARTAFEHALTIDPQSDLALAGLGMVAANTGDLESGWNYYQRSLKVNPENPRALLGSIELAYRIHRLPELQVILGLYLERHPIDFKFLYALAGCLFAQNKLREAAEEVEKILIFEPHNINAIELKRLVEERSVVTPAQAPSGALNSL